VNVLASAENVTVLTHP